ncbi:MAG: SDR family NAD(P)-dependent oxidoreductase [Spirochaetales bacterium]
MPLELAQKWIWITGASSGIGRQLALEAASKGARVLLSGRHRETLERVEVDCQVRSTQNGHAGGHALLVFDLLDRPARIHAVSQALAVAGTFALVILNAGISQRSSFADLSPLAFDQILDLDFMAPVDLTRALLPSMQPGSGFVLVSSVSGLLGTPGRSAYSAAKHALTGFGAVLRSELYSRQISVTTAFPGYVRTGIDRAALGADGAQQGHTDARTQKGADPAVVAQKLLRDAQGGKAHSYLAFKLESHYGLWAARLLPGLYARVSSKRR